MAAVDQEGLLRVALIPVVGVALISAGTMNR
jgi:hypothetical protein